MNSFSSFTRRILILLFLVGFLLPTIGFAQNLRDDRPERRNDDYRQHTQQLRERADQLRERVLQRKPGTQEQKPQLEVQRQEESQEEPVRKARLEEKVEEVQDAKEHLQGNPRTLENQKNLLLRTIESLEEHTRLLELRIRQLPVIQRDVKQSLQAELAADLAVFETFRVRAQEAENAEELRLLAQEIKAYREDVTQTKTRKLMLLAHADVFEHHILELASTRANRIAEHLLVLEESGKSIAELEHLLSEAQENIEQANQEVANVKENIFEHNVDDAVLRNAQESFTDIKQRVKASYSLFRQIAQQAREM